MEYLMPRQFIPIHPCLKVALSVPEFNVYTSIIEQSMKLNKGYSKNYWSQATFLDYTTLGRTAFNGALDKLINKGLVVAQMRGNGMRNCYDVVESEFLALHEIFEINRDRKILGKFFKSYWKTNRRISEVTDEEIEALRSSGKLNKIGEDVAKSENFKRYRRKTTVNASENDGSTVGKRRCYIDSIDNKEISGCNPPNRGESFQDKIIDIPDIIYFDKNKKEESGSNNKIIEEDMEKEEDIFNLFDELSDDNKENYSFLEKKKQKNTLGAKAPKNSDNPLDILEIYKDNNVIPSNILKELNSDEHIEEFKNILFYFSKKYINGSCVKLDEAEKYYQELRDDYFSSDELLETSIRDVFKHFIYIDDEVYTFYNKVDCSLIKVANEEFYNNTEIPNNIDFPDNLKNNEKEEFVINEFIKQFEGIGIIELKSANSFIAGLMKGLNMMYFQKYLINQPRLAPMIIKELEHRGEDESDNYWELPNNTKNNKSELLDVVGSEISKVEEKIKVNNNINSSSYNYKLSVNELKENNIFIDIFNDFRITRRMNVFNVPDMASRMLKFALIEESDTITLEEKEKLLYAISNKLGLEHTDNRITDLYGSVIKNKIK